MNNFERRLREYKRAQWEKQKIINEAMMDLKKQDRVAFVKFVFIVIVVLGAAAGVVYLACIAPTLLLG